MMKHTDLQEGIMVRCIQRVDELLKNIRLAAKNLESKEFEEKLERASRLIRRDIVFAPSLYTVQDGIVGVFEEEESQPQVVIKKEKEVKENDDAVKEVTQQDGEAEDEDDFEEEDEDDALFTYNFAANDEETLNSETFQEEEQFNSNFL